MRNTILLGDARELARTLPDDSVHIPPYYSIIWCMRNKKGQIKKGMRLSPETEFKPGEHWRPHQSFRDKEWLIEHYVNQQMSAGEIAEQFGVTYNAVWYWMRKHGIERRNISEAREIKHWGASGEDNPMYGRTGDQNPNWKGGITPERQAFYSSLEWGKAVESVWERDKGICQRCGESNPGPHRMHIHHIIDFKVEKYRADVNYLVTLCYTCHAFVHSKRNINNEFIDNGKEGDGES